MKIDGTDFSSALAELDKYIETESNLIAILHRAQELVGYLPAPLQEWVARRMSIPLAKVNGVVTFYSYFKQTPRGKYHIDVCLGTACYVQGGEAVLETIKEMLGIEVGQTTPDKLFSIGDVRCIGACGLAPAISVNGKIHGQVNSQSVRTIINYIREQEGL